MRHIAILGIVGALAACSPGDAPPRNAVEGELSMLVIPGRSAEGDRNFGMQLSILIDGEQYILDSNDSPQVIGFDAVRDPMQLSGRKVLVAGKVEGDTYMATYLQLLEGEGSGEVTLGVPTE